LYPVRSEVCALPPPQERGEEGVEAVCPARLVDRKDGE